MKSARFAPLLAVLMALSAAAQNPATGLSLQPPGDLPTAQAQYAAALKTVTVQRDERLSVARKAYAEILGRAQKDATAKGDLDGALAAKTEQASLAAGGELSPESRKALPAAVQPARARFDQSATQTEAQARALEAGLIRSYIATLEALQRRITMKGDLEGAIRVKDERQAIAARLSALETGKTAAAAAAPPLLPAGSAMTTLVTRTPALEVAAALQAKGAATNPAPNAIVFDGPPGDGRRGAKGILLKAEPGAGGTWTFKYRRGGSAFGVQIIHPMGRGQAIVHLEKEGVWISTPKVWTDVGWSSEAAKEARGTKAFGAAFPLKDAQEYDITSRLSAGGAFELLIDGQLVATGRAAGPSPLSLEIPEGKTFRGAGRGKLEFKGQDFPLKWAPGWAGVLLGPLDNGEHAARELRFSASAAESGTVR